MARPKDVVSCINNKAQPKDGVFDSNETES